MPVLVVMLVVRAVVVVVMVRRVTAVAAIVVRRLRPVGVVVIVGMRIDAAGARAVCVVGLLGGGLRWLTAHIRIISPQGAAPDALRRVLDPSRLTPVGLCAQPHTCERCGHVVANPTPPPCRRSSR
ncbi:hypothetical protein Cs7R123_52280 [Catellatospora sp. TT07R-123]|nr:hypothetical protein Cs7R123_52280 [Catellatospora sp. TT07R-123]